MKPIDAIEADGLSITAFKCGQCGRKVGWFLSEDQIHVNPCLACLANRFANGWTTGHNTRTNNPPDTIGDQP